MANYSGQAKYSYSLKGLNLIETCHFDGRVSIKDFPLVEVTRKELMRHRLSSEPGFVLKTHGKLYYTPFPTNVHLSDQKIGVHLCGDCRKICGHCEKINAWNKQFHIRMGHNFYEAVYLAGRIEKYDFIPYAIETFNCSLDVYLVMKCTRFESRGA